MQLLILPTPECTETLRNHSLWQGFSGDNTHEILLLGGPSSKSYSALELLEGKETMTEPAPKMDQLGIHLNEISMHCVLKPFLFVYCEFK